MAARVGSRRGVRRGVGTRGVILVNGHDPINPALREAILSFMRNLRRPTTAAEVATTLGYSRSHIRNVMSSMSADGDIVFQNQGQTSGHVGAIFSLTGPPAEPLEPVKSCCSCRRSLPISHFGRDRHMPDGRMYRCKDCRSPRPERRALALAGGPS